MSDTTVDEPDSLKSKIIFYAIATVAWTILIVGCVKISDHYAHLTCDGGKCCRGCSTYGGVIPGCKM